MRVASVALAAFLAFAGAAGCGGEGDPSRLATGAARGQKTFAAAPTLMAGGSARLFTIPELGRFAARCKAGPRGEISYVAFDGGQLVTTDGRRSGSNTWLKPDQRLSVAVGRVSGPRVEWQIAVLSQGGIEIVIADFTLGELPGSGGRGCFFSARAEVTRRQR